MKPSDFYNPMTRLLLRSPLHFLLSGSFMLLSFTGRKSGKSYTIPVNYFFDGDRLTVFTRRERRWWRNLSGGAPVRVRLGGRERRGVAEAFPRDAVAFRAAIRAYLERYPGRAKHFGIAVRSDGTPEERSVEQAARGRVVLRIDLE